MTRMKRPVLVVLSLVLTSIAFAQSAQMTQKLLDTEGAKLRAWGSDRTLVAFVKNQNLQRVQIEKIKSLDEAWSQGKNEALVRQVTSGPCADHLRKLVASNAAYGETFLMDDQGALVCASQRTSDYWQGDEPKWQRAFDGGKGTVFIDRPRFDDSSSRNLAQISVPVVENGRAIGVITVGVTIDKLK